MQTVHGMHVYRFLMIQFDGARRLQLNLQVRKMRRGNDVQSYQLEIGSFRSLLSTISHKVHTYVPYCRGIHWSLEVF